MSSDLHATITYTSMSSYQVIVNRYYEMPMDPLDPYVQLIMEAPPSPDYIPEPEAPPSPDYIPGPEAPPSPDYIPGPEYPEYLPPADDVLPAEEQPLLAAVSPTVESSGYITNSEPEMEPKEEDGDDEKSEGDSIDEEEEEEHLALTVPAPALYSFVSASEETKPFEEGKAAATPPPFGYRVAARIYVQPHILMPFRSESEDEGIELVADQEKDAEVEGRHADKQAEIYNIDLDHSLKVLSMQEDDTEVQEAVEIITTAKLMTKVVTAAATQVATGSTSIPAAKPKTLTITAAPAISIRRRKGVVIRDPEEELPCDTPAQTPKVKDKGKGILIEAPKPMKKKDQIEMDAGYARKLQEEINKEHEEAYKNIDWNAALDHVQSKEPRTLKVTRWISLRERRMIKFFQSFKPEGSKEKKLSEEAQKADDLRKRLEIVQDEDDDVFVKATPLAQKVPIVDYHIVVIDNKPKYKIIRADDTHQFYISFTTLLKNFDRFIEDINVARLQVEEESKMSLELLRFTRQKHQEYQKMLYGEIKRVFMVWHW
nr:hypothetical protein [Tanacetum cinerariifolium]